MKKRKKRNLQGTVLFTTVSVMALLILFLVGTLALASASNNRAHKSYSSSQANYTAKAAIDGFTMAMRREAGVAAAVNTLAEAGTAGDVIYPRIEMSEGSLGHIGCYDDSGNWLDNQIRVESVADDVYEYMGKSDVAAYGEAEAKWSKLRRVRISASVRVGKEEETVVAYLQKRPTDSTIINNNSGQQIKGLQMAGSAGFPSGHYITGGLGVNLSQVSGEAVTKLRNEMNIETSLSFINSDLVWNTTNQIITVKEPNPVDNEGNPAPVSLPYSQTVINGNLWLANNYMVRLDYDMPDGYQEGQWDIKKVPYMYIDGAFTGPSTDMNLVTNVRDNNVPFNLFVGTFNTDGVPKMTNTNLYLMDEPNGESYTVYKECKTENIEGYIQYYNGGDPNSTVSIPVGKNKLCGSSGANLYQWTSSIADSNLNNNKYNVGGNIYCNGDLELQGIEVQGDVCVKGNCTIGSGVVIHGRLICGHQPTVNSSATISGGTFVQNGTTTPSTTTDKAPRSVPNIAKDTVTSIDVNTLQPIDDLRVDYYKWIPEEHLDGNGNACDPWGNNVDEYDRDPYYDPDPLVFDHSSPRYYSWNSEYRKGEAFDITHLVDDPIKEDAVKYMDTNGAAYYNAMPVYENGEVFISGSPAEDGETYYLDPNSNTILTQTFIDDPNNGIQEYWRADADGNVTADDAPDHDAGTNQYTYYKLDADDNPTGEYSFVEADMVNTITTGGGGGASGLPDDIKEIYPSNMTKDKIYGTKDPVTGAFTEPNESTKIIVNIKEARESLGLDPVMGTPKEESYPTDFPDGHIMTTDWRDYDVYQSGQGTISENTVINSAPNEDITVSPPSGTTINIVLDGGEDYDSPGLTFENKWINVESTGNVNIFIKGKVTFHGGGIKPTIYQDGLEFDHMRDWGIVFYGFENSRIVLSNSAGILVGSFKCPGTEFVQAVEGPEIRVKYRDENGVVHEPGVTTYLKVPSGTETEHFPCIVGNALFKGVYSQNFLENYYTASGSGLGGSGTGSTSTIVTQLGYFDIMYWAAS